MTSVWPSGGLFAAASMPMFPPAPALFSTMTGCPSNGASRSATQRARISRGLPGGDGAIIRTAQGVMLTAAGRAFVARGRVIHGELRKVHDDLAALRGIAEGAVSFGSGPAVTFPLVPDAMSRFRAKWPRAHVRIREGMRNAL